VYRYVEAAQRVERQVLLKVASDFAEQLHPVNDKQLGAVMAAMNDPKPSVRIAELRKQDDENQLRLEAAAAEADQVGGCTSCIQLFTRSF
jgi:hypothetical protein